MNRSVVLGDALTVLMRSRDYILMAEMFNKSPLQPRTAITEEYREVVNKYSAYMNREISDAMACMSLIMFGSLFLNDLFQSPLRNDDFGSERRTEVDYFRGKRNNYIAHRNRVDAIELPFKNAEIRRGGTLVDTMLEGRLVASPLPAGYFTEEERVKFLDLLEHTVDLLGKKWDQAYEAEKRIY